LIVKAFTGIKPTIVTTELTVVIIVPCAVRPYRNRKSIPAEKSS